MAEQLDMLTSFVVASPARTSAPPDEARDLPALAPGCGSKCDESCPRCGPFGSLLRMSLLFEVAALTRCTPTWSRKATPGGSSWWVLTTSERAIDESEPGESSDDWPTPTATPYGSSNNGCPGDGREEYATKGRASLETMAQDWPIPRASLNEQRQTKPSPSQLAKKHGRNLATEANRENWPTPLAVDQRGSAGVGKSELPNAVKTWPTPRANERDQQNSADNGVALSFAAKTWPTPRAEDCEQTGAHRGTPDTLTSMMRLWPTATAGDGKASGSRTTTDSSAHAGISLTDAAVHGMTIDSTARRQWASPLANDWKPTPGQQLSNENTEGAPRLALQVFDGLQDPASSSTPGKSLEPSLVLNSSWVFQLMGYPARWARLSTRRA